MFVAHASKSRDLDRVAEVPRTRSAVDERIDLFVVQKARNLCESDDRVDRPACSCSLAAPRHRPELGIDLGCDLGEQVEVVGTTRSPLGQRVIEHFLLEHHYVLHQYGMQRAGVEE